MFNQLVSATEGEKVLCWVYVKLLTVRLAGSTSVIVLYTHVLIHWGLYIMHTNATSINLVK